MRTHGPTGLRGRQGRTPKTPFETENNASRVKARRNRRLAECVGCGQKAHSRMIALAEFAQALPYCKKRLLPCQRRQALIFPERQGGASVQALSVELAAKSPDKVPVSSLQHRKQEPITLPLRHAMEPIERPRHSPKSPSNYEGSVIGKHLLASRRDSAYSSFSQLFRNIQFREKRVTYCGVEQSGSSPGS